MRRAGAACASLRWRGEGCGLRLKWCACAARARSVWILHAMLLLANAAGLAFVPHLKHLLNLAEASLLSGEGRQAAG